jgi:hypothetical protein
MAETFTFADPNQDDHGYIGDDFDRWMDVLNEEVIQGEYGYEHGEFEAYPSLWWSLYHRRMTPSEAFAYALKVHRT